MSVWVCRRARRIGPAIMIEAAHVQIFHVMKQPVGLLFDRGVAAVSCKCGPNITFGRRSYDALDTLGGECIETIALATITTFATTFLHCLLHSDFRYFCKHYALRIPLASLPFAIPISLHAQGSYASTSISTCISSSPNLVTPTHVQSGL